MCISTVPYVRQYPSDVRHAYVNVNKVCVSVRISNLPELKMHFSCCILFPEHTEQRDLADRQREIRKMGTVESDSRSY